MSPIQLWRMVWARKWLVLFLFLLIAPAGSYFVYKQPKLYTATSSLVVDARPDPILGALAAPANVATQLEILKSDKVASRVVKMLGVERSPAAVQQWREETKAKIPLDRYFADLLEKGLMVDGGRNYSNVITINFTAQDPAFAAATANAFAQAAMDISVEMRVNPARQSVDWLDGQTKTLRTNLEAAQAKLSKFQQEKGIVVTDERLDIENARLNALTAQIASAQAEQLEAMSRQRSTGDVASPDVQNSPAVQSLRNQLSLAETKLGEISSVVGSNHPQRLQLEAQISELKQQLASELRRVTSTTTVVSRNSSAKVNELKAMADAQKRQLLSLRSERDQIAVLQRDVDTAQRAYEAVSARSGQLVMESQTNSSNLRLLSQAVEPFEPSQKKLITGIAGSIIGGLVVAMAVALAIEFLNRRVRGVEDLTMMHGVPVIGVLRPAGSKQPVFRQLSAVNAPPGRLQLPMGGART